jgi:dCMP deaminase
MMKSDHEYLVEAYKIATKSPDPSTQNGAVIVYEHFTPSENYNDPFEGIGKSQFCEIAACNDFPEGVNLTEDRLQRPLKYNFIEHAERAAILKAAKLGVCLDGLTMYVCWAACSDCARAIIGSGIKKIVTHKRMMDRTPDHWKESISHAFKMFEEAKIEVVQITLELPNAPKIRFNGELWQP